MTKNCRLCGNTENNRLHRAREMMFGTRDAFEYVECAACGTLQIAAPPDLAPYYPKEYYSLEDSAVPLADNFKSRLAARLAAAYLTGGRNLAGRWLASRKDWIDAYFPPSLREKMLGLRRDSRILDFGSGGGKLLRTLAYFGFRDLTGADAFIDGDLVYPDGVRVLRRGLGELEPFYDLVMMHHSFEHLPDPRATLAAAARLLPAGKFCLVRIPLVAAAWEKYGVDWVQLDAPRHLFLFTERAFRRLAEDGGFAVEKVVYDSEAFQFYASEQYARDIPLSDARAFRGDFAASIFTAEQMLEFEREAARLNREGRGDQACFYLRKI